MASSLRMDAIELVLVIAESILYGIFIVLLCGALAALVERRRQGQSTTLLLTVSGCLFCTITLHLVLDIVRIFDAFIHIQSGHVAGYNPPPPPPGVSPATQYFETLYLKKYIVVSCFYVITTSIGDGFMIYRLYIVWNRQIWITIVPLAFQIAMCASGGYIQWLVAMQYNTDLFATAGGWITAWYALTLCTNLICAVLIAYKVWLSKRSISRLGNENFTPLQRVMNALIQSAALYSLCLFLSLVLYARKNNIQFIFAATNCPVVGIVFTMIAVRPSPSLRAVECGSESHTLRELRPVAIKITREVNTYSHTHPFSNGKASRLQEIEETVLDVSDRSHKMELDEAA